MFAPVPSACLVQTHLGSFARLRLVQCRKHLVPHLGGDQFGFVPVRSFSALSNAFSRDRKVGLPVRGTIAEPDQTLFFRRIVCLST
jgi:hypothetical protein